MNEVFEEIFEGFNRMNKVLSKMYSNIKPTIESPIKNKENKENKGE